jgi:PAS domain S-box-containing protein
MTKPSPKSKRKTPAKPAASPLDQHKVMRSIITSMSDGVMVINSQGEIVLTNPALGAILDLSEPEMQGKGWAELFFGEPGNYQFNQIIVDVITERIYHHNQQVSYLAPDGKRKELIVTTTLMTNGRDPQELGGVLLVFKDISQISALHQRSQELLSQSRRLYQEKLEGVDRLARAVAHEIRNPVTSIGGLARRLLKGTAQGSRDAQYLQHILAATQRLERVVSESRAFSDLPAPHLEEVDIRAWLSELVKPFRGRARRQGVSLGLGRRPRGAVQLNARIDPLLLGRIITILLTNALEAMPHGGKLKVRVMSDEVSLVITVSDTGKGINPADMPYLFDPFFTTKADAVGMSLAIARRIATEHQGELNAVSRPGQGCTFTLTVPLQGGLGGEPDPRKPRQPSWK